MLDLLIPLALFSGLMYFGGKASEWTFRYFHHGKVKRTGMLTIFEENLIERDRRITGSEFIQNDSLSFKKQ